MVDEVNNQRDVWVDQIKDHLRPLMKRANQRLLRLEKEGLTDNLAYKAVVDARRMGLDPEKPRFNFGNKSLEELQDMRLHVTKFLDYKTGTVSGAKEQLQRMSKQMRVSYADNEPTRIYSNASTFYRISNKVMEYIRSGDAYAYIDSDQVFDAVSHARDIGLIDLAHTDPAQLSLDDMESIVALAVQRGTSRFTGDVFTDIESVGRDDYDNMDFVNVDPR